jgi:hypothetical protein
MVGFLSGFAIVCANRSKGNSAMVDPVDTAREQIEEAHEERGERDSWPR